MAYPWGETLARQYAAALQMVRLSIEACPEELWDDRSRGTPFWHLAYHALFFADLYLSKDETSFEARPLHRDKSQYLPGDYGDFAGVVGTPDEVFTREELLEYADHCLDKSDAAFAALTDVRALERCGFRWYELNLGEFLLNSLRHTQSHAGQLTLLLRRGADVGIDWLGSRDNQPPEPTW
jgi:hypothetical protein